MIADAGRARDSLEISPVRQPVSRRDFLKASALGAAAVAIDPRELFADQTQIKNVFDKLVQQLKDTHAAEMEFNDGLAFAAVVDDLFVNDTVQVPNIPEPVSKEGVSDLQRTLNDPNFHVFFADKNREYLSAYRKAQTPERRIEILARAAFDYPHPARRDSELIDKFYKDVLSTFNPEYLTDLNPGGKSSINRDANKTQRDMWRAMLTITSSLSKTRQETVALNLKSDELKAQLEETKANIVRLEAELEEKQEKYQKAVKEAEQATKEAEQATKDADLATKDADQATRDANDASQKVDDFRTNYLRRRAEREQKRQEEKRRAGLVTTAKSS